MAPSTPPPQRSLNQPNTSTAIILSSDEELGPNECTPPRPSTIGLHNRQPPGPNQASSSRYYYHDRVTVDGPLGDANPILNPITLDRPGPSRFDSFTQNLKPYSIFPAAHNAHTSKANAVEARFIREFTMKQRRAHARARRDMRSDPFRQLILTISERRREKRCDTLVV